MVRLLFLLWTLVSTWLLGTCQESFQKNDTDLIDSMVNELMKCKKIPGLGISMIRDRQFFAKGYGYARLDPPVNFTETTPIYIASLGKAFTSALLGILITESRSNRDWDTKLSAIFKDLDLPKDKDILESDLNIKDLLSHRTGFSPADVYTGVPKIGRAQYVRRLKHLPQSASFRDQWIYNDLLYAIAGHVAEVWTGSSYENLVGTKLLGALGMFQAVCGTSIYPSDAQSTFALPYHLSNGKLRQGDGRIYQIGDVGPAGCISASPQDLAKWIRFMATGGKAVDGNQLIHPDVFSEILKPHMYLDDWSIGRFNLDKDYPVRASGTWYGYGWYGGYYRGYRKLLHPGNWYGYNAVAGVFPDQKAGFVITVNGPWYMNYRHNLAQLSYVLSDILLGEKQWIDNSTICSFPSPWKNPSTSSSNNTRSSQSTVNDVNQYIGDYAHRIFGNFKIREIESGKLSFQMNSAGIGNLTVDSEAEAKFGMTFNELMNDVAESTCSLQFVEKKKSKFQKVKVSCFYASYEYERGVDFLADEPTNAASKLVLTWLFLPFFLLHIIL